MKIGNGHFPILFSMEFRRGKCLRHPKPLRGRKYSGVPRPTTQQPQPYEGQAGGYGFDINGDGGYEGYGDDEGHGEPIDDGYDGEPEQTPQEFNDAGSGRSLIDVASNAISQCPVENGVMRTTWGAVAAGPLIAGTAFHSTSDVVRII